MVESSFGAILGSLRMNRSIVDSPRRPADGPPVHRIAEYCYLVMICYATSSIVEYMNLMVNS